MVKLSSLNTFGTTEGRIELRIGHAEWAIVNAIEVRHIAYRVSRFLRMMRFIHRGRSKMRRRLAKCEKPGEIGADTTKR